mmetsp:Transcript_17189/g.23621  ORF Transcript_17189/g.23621 Transcript_17189/m.23621 type:complete len:1185 (+) Transcript_17189:168-3722(+)
MRAVISTINKTLIEPKFLVCVQKSELNTLFHIRFELNNEGGSWEIFRSLEDCKDFLDEMKDNENSEFDFVVGVGEELSANATKFENILNDLLRKNGEKLWLNKSLVKFIKGHHVDSVVATCQLNFMMAEINRLSSMQEKPTSRNSTSNLNVYSTESNRVEDDMVSNLSGVDSRNTREATPPGNLIREENIRKNAMAADTPPWEPQVYAGNKNALGGFIEEERQRNVRPPPTRESYGYTTHSQQQYSHHQPLQSNPRAYTSHNSYDNLTGPPRNNGDYINSNHSNNNRMTRQPMNQQTPLSSGVPDLRLTKEQIAMYDVACERILQVCGPHDEQIAYRNSVFALLQKHIRIALGSAALDISLQVLNCFLPDDPIKLSVVLVKTVNPSSDFSKTLSDEFNYLAEMSLRKSIRGGRGVDGGDEFPYTANHILKNVKVTKHNVGIKLICSVDEFIDVEIVFNNRNDLCMLTFVEEVSLLVGKNNLFKRSLMLIRTWWFYETAAYMGSSIKHYLSDFSLCVMITAIFNQFHKQISTPMEALCIFLNEYADYDGHSQAITLQGIVPFMTGPHHNQPKLRLAGNEFLISNQIIDKYSFMFRVGQQVPQSRDQLSISSALMNISSKFSGNYAHDSADIYQVTISRRLVDGYSKPIFSSKIESFTRSTFNIVHPFAYTNMITVNLSHTRLTKLTRAFHVGKVTLSAVLESSRENISSQGGMIQNFYQVFLARFANEWRPDIVSSHLTTTLPRESPFVRVVIDNIWQNILYCNLIMDTMCSDSAVVSVCIEDIACHGPRPVQDLVKTLTDVTGLPTLSFTLKEKYGGLKQFLERFPDTFVFSSKTNFNPMVMLRSNLNSEELAMLENGDCPPHLSNDFAPAIETPVMTGLGLGYPTHLAVSEHPRARAAEVPTHTSRLGPRITPSQHLLQPPLPPQQQTLSSSRVGGSYYSVEPPVKTTLSVAAQPWMGSSTAPVMNNSQIRGDDRRSQMAFVPSNMSTARNFGNAMLSSNPSLDGDMNINSFNQNLTGFSSSPVPSNASNTLQWEDSDHHHNLLQSSVSNFVVNDADDNNTYSGMWGRSAGNHGSNVGGGGGSGGGYYAQPPTGNSDLSPFQSYLPTATSDLGRQPFMPRSSYLEGSPSTTTMSSQSISSAFLSTASPSNSPPQPQVPNLQVQQPPPPTQEQTQLPSPESDAS